MLITGAMRLADPDKPSNSGVYNSIYVIDQTGSIAAVYDKVHLVPFGEYLPFEHILERLGLQELTKQRGGFLAGDRRRLIFNSRFRCGRSLERNSRTERSGLGAKALLRSLANKSIRDAAQVGLANVSTDKSGVPRYIPMIYETPDGVAPSFALAAASQEARGRASL